MPKKTRKEKILAQARRSAVPIAMSRPAAPGPSTPISASYSFREPLIDKKHQKQNNEEVIELSAIKSDLYKTILIAIGAFGIELYLYWVL